MSWFTKHVVCQVCFAETLGCRKDSPIATGNWPVPSSWKWHSLFFCQVYAFIILNCCWCHDQVNHVKLLHYLFTCSYLHSKLSVNGYWPSFVVDIFNNMKYFTWDEHQICWGQLWSALVWESCQPQLFQLQHYFCLEEASLYLRTLWILCPQGEVLPTWLNLHEHGIFHSKPPYPDFSNHSHFPCRSTLMLVWFQVLGRFGKETLLWFRKMTRHFGVIETNLEIHSCCGESLSIGFRCLDHTLLHCCLWPRTLKRKHAWLET